MPFRPVLEITRGHGGLDVKEGSGRDARYGPFLVLCVGTHGEKRVSRIDTLFGHLTRPRGHHVYTREQRIGVVLRVVRE